MWAVLRKYWVGELIIGGVFGAILLVAAILSPSPEAVSLFGFDIPVMCTFRSLSGLPCPGCGLTRSFSFMAHGDPISAFQMNMLGPILFLAFATQPPYRLYTAFKDYFSSPEIA